MMKKIIVLINGIRAPWHIITFSLNIAKQNNAGVYALFIKNERRNFSYPSDMESTETNLTGEKEKVENEHLEEKNIEVFKSFCNDEKVKCHFEKNISLKQLVDASSGADIIVADSHDDFQRRQCSAGFRRRRYRPALDGIGKDRKSTRLNSSHHTTSRMPSSA